MTRPASFYLFMTVLASIILPTTVTSVQAQANKYYEACQTFGGEYEERRTNCTPECKSTFICQFDDGWSRVCDQQGICEQVQDGAATTTAAGAGASERDDPDSADEGSDSFEDCVADAGDHCRKQCDGELGLDGVDCARDCLEDIEGQCEEFDTESFDSGSSNSECDDCRVLCEDACNRFRQSWRRDDCLSECGSRCDYLCD